MFPKTASRSSKTARIDCPTCICSLAAPIRRRAQRFRGSGSTGWGPKRPPNAGGCTTTDIEWTEFDSDRRRLDPARRHVRRMPRPPSAPPLRPFARLTTPSDCLTLRSSSCGLSPGGRNFSKRAASLQIVTVGKAPVRRLSSGTGSGDRVGEAVHAINMPVGAKAQLFGKGGIFFDQYGRKREGLMTVDCFVCHEGTSGLVPSFPESAFREIRRSGNFLFSGVL